MGVDGAAGRPLPAGSSGRALPDKLGIRAGDTVLAIGAPRPYADLASPLPDGVQVVARARHAHVVHLFLDRAAELERRLPALRKVVFPAGALWVSWPKKASGVPTDVTEDVVRAAALRHGLVDVKVCAVDAVWSGLKLVVPVAQRST